MATTQAPRSTPKVSSSASRPTTASSPTTAPAAPAAPGRASGLSMGVEVSRPGTTAATIDRIPPATLAAAAHRQPGERSRPSGTSSAGRVTPRAMAGAHSGSATAALTLAVSGRGRPVATRLLTRLAGHVQGPEQARGGQQPPDRVGRPAQAQDQSEHGKPEVEHGGHRPLGQHPEGHGPLLGGSALVRPEHPRPPVRDRYGPGAGGPGPGRAPARGAPDHDGPRPAVVA
jgi:hypothetical protein